MNNKLRSCVFVEKKFDYVDSSNLKFDLKFDFITFFIILLVKE